MCEIHGPRASGRRDRKPSCHVFHTSRQAMIKTYNIEIYVVIGSSSDNTGWENLRISSDERLIVSMG